MKIPSRLSWLVLAACAASASAQQAADTQVDQLAEGDRSVVSAAPAVRDRMPTQQLSSPAEGRQFERPVVTPGARAGAPVQLAPTGRNAGAPAQLAPAGRTAAASPALSRPAEGRTGTAERIAGADRCDPYADGAARPQCQRVIETRSGEFVRPDPAALSPEQRLLAERQIGTEPARTLSSAAQRLANNVGDPSSLEAQSVAAVTLARDPGVDAPGKDATSQVESAAAAAALVNAVLGSGTVVVDPSGK